LYGARSPQDLIFRREISAWSARGKIRATATVDQADRSWQGQVGTVMGALQRPDVASADGFAFICGPEVMMRFAALRLLDLGYAPERIFVSLERNMKCAVGHCGRCQVGPHFLCRDGPIFRYDRVRPMLAIKEI
jgi:NAD(P)H-flavin reductase